MKHNREPCPNMDYSATEPSHWSVTELNQRIRENLEEGFAFVRVRGEVQGWKLASSGHGYFTLGDGASLIRAVIWRTTLRRLSELPKEGAEVLVSGRITTYPQRGEYQLVVEGCRLAGAGLEREKLLQLHARLAAEGLFDAERKRPLPFWPKVVGVVTSPDGAAIHDIIKVLSDRHPGFHLLLSPARVQGNEAPEEIARALAALNADGRAEVIICGRGGGASEDLAAFNSEIVVRAIAACPVPVVSAVGHEVDLTLADLVADQRAATPSAAAEMVLPTRRSLEEGLNTLRERLLRAESLFLQRKSQLLEETRRRLRHPRHRLDEGRFRCEEAMQRLPEAMGRFLERKQLKTALLREGLNQQGKHLPLRWPHARLALLKNQLNLDRLLAEHRARLTRLQARLEAANPHAVLHRGYALIRDDRGRLLRQPSQCHPGDLLTLQLDCGQIDVQVIETRIKP
ncbi:MAG: exodeoxyribonuclease VII large subunit [Magnetococcales bacterium]|nr:exodeoxyribonuclease VII large subunit [Magnetococcales bacterium]